MGKLSLVFGLRLREAEEVVWVADPVRGGASPCSPSSHTFVVVVVLRGSLFSEMNQYSDTTTNSSPKFIPIYSNILQCPFSVL